MNSTWADQHVGQVLRERYRLDKLIGVGGMGAVYQATHLTLDRAVAVKLMAPGLLDSGEFLERFHREAKSVVIIESPGIVEILDFDVDPNCGAFLVMEYLDGESLTDRIRRTGALPVPEGVEIAGRVLDTLQTVHQKGVIHRDLKPDNIFLTRDAEGKMVVKMLDFGLAKMHSAARKTALTMPGIALGTPRYMAPEQAQGKEVDHRADVYAAGIILYSALSGMPPYADVHNTPMDLMKAVLRGPPKSVSSFRPDVPPGILEVVDRSLRPIHERYQSAAEMGAALRHALGLATSSTIEVAAANGSPLPSDPPRKRVAWFLLGVIGGVILLGALIATIVSIVFFQEQLPSVTPPEPPEVIPPATEVAIDAGPPHHLDQELAAADDHLEHGRLQPAKDGYESVLRQTGNWTGHARRRARAHIGLAEVEMRPLLDISDDRTMQDANITYDDAARRVAEAQDHLEQAILADPSQGTCLYYRSGLWAEKLADIIENMDPDTVVPGDLEQHPNLRHQAGELRDQAKQLYQQAIDQGTDASCSEDALGSLARLE